MVMLASRNNSKRVDKHEPKQIPLFSSRIIVNYMNVSYLNKKTVTYILGSTFIYQKENRKKLY